MVAETVMKMWYCSYILHYDIIPDDGGKEAKTVSERFDWNFILARLHLVAMKASDFVTVILHLWPS
jgi:hypothetical protein